MVDTIIVEIGTASVTEVVTDGPQGIQGETGGVDGPASSVEDNFASFADTSGSLIKDSGSKASDFEMAGAAATVQGSLNTHTGNTTDAHGIDGKVDDDDSRLSDAREWTASTVSQAEAKAGTATDRRAWTAERVHQAIVALGDGVMTMTRLVQVAPDLGSVAYTNPFATEFLPEYSVDCAGPQVEAIDFGGL